MWMGLGSLFAMCGLGGHWAGIPPKLFVEDGIKRRLRRALDQPEREVELRADIVAFVTGQRESHEGLGFDLRAGIGEAGVELVSGRIKFCDDRFGKRKG